MHKLREESEGHGKHLTGRALGGSLSRVSKPEIQKHLEDWCDGQEVNSTRDLM